MNKPKKILETLSSYDFKNYTRNRLNTRVVIRNKSFIPSRFERMLSWLRPKMHIDPYVYDSTQIFKLILMMVSPLFCLAYWRSMQRATGHRIEEQTQLVQHRPMKEAADGDGGGSEHYHDIMDNFEERRAKALHKMQKENRAANPSRSSSS